MLLALEIHDLVTGLELGYLHNRSNVTLGIELAVSLVVRGEELDVLLQVSEPGGDTSGRDDQQTLSIRIALDRRGTNSLFLSYLLRLPLHYPLAISMGKSSMSWVGSPKSRLQGDGMGGRQRSQAIHQGGSWGALYDKKCDDREVQNGMIKRRYI